MSWTFYLEKCLSPINEVRVEGENYINEAIKNTFFQTWYDFCIWLSNESIQTELRQLCATLIKNTLHNSIYINKWEETPIEQRDKIKEIALSCLASSQREIRSATSLVIASICRIEIPKRLWNSIFDLWFKTSNNENINFKTSSINTISYIVEELEVEDLSQEQINTFLGAIILNLNSKAYESNVIVLEYALRALFNILPFTEKNFSSAEERKLIINNVLELLRVDYLSDDIKQLGMKCWVEMGRWFYVHLVSHMNDITNITCKYITNTNPMLSIQGWEFWCSWLDSEWYLKKNIISNLYQDSLYNAIEYILVNRTEKQEKEYIESGEWTAVKAATLLLSQLGQSKNQIIIDKVWSFVSTHLHSPNNYLHRDSAYLAYGAIVEYPKIEAEIVWSSIVTILDDMNKEIANVNLSCTWLWCFNQICEYHIYLFNENEKLLDNIIEKIIIFLKNPQQKRPIILKTFTLLNTIVVNLKQNDFFIKHWSDLFGILLQFAYFPGAYDPNVNVTLSAFFVLGHIIEKVDLNNKNINTEKVKEVVTFLFGQLYQKLQDSLNSQNFRSIEEQQAYQSYICTTISSCCVSGDKIVMTQTQLTSVYNWIKLIFTSRGSVTEEGWNAISSLSFSSPAEYYVNTILPDFSQYIVLALQSKQAVSICLNGINTVSELIRSLDTHVIQYLTSYLPYIFDIWKDIHTDKALKTNCFLVLNDMFCLTTAAEPYNYYHQSMNLVVTAIQASMVPFKKNEEQENIDYLLLLRERILEFLNCVFHFLLGYNKIHEFIPYIEGIMSYINTICQKEYLPNLDILLYSIGLIGDWSYSVPSKMKYLINENIVNYMINEINQRGGNNDNKTISYAKDNISYALSY